MAGDPWWVAGGSSLPSHTQGSNRMCRGSYLLPLDCSHGMRQVPHLGGLWVTGQVLLAGADLRNQGPRDAWGQSPLSSCGSFSQAQRQLSWLLPKPGVPQTGLGRLILSEGPHVSRWLTGPLGSLKCFTSWPPCFSQGEKLRQLDRQRRSKTVISHHSSSVASDLWLA